jgi:hypothetical protein
MRGFRLYSAMLIGAIGLLGGCTHTTEIGVNRSGETLYLKTTCMPAFTIASGLGGLAIVADAPEYYFGAIIGASAFDYLRCGLRPPKVSTDSDEAKVFTDSEEQGNQESYVPPKATKYSCIMINCRCFEDKSQALKEACKNKYKQLCESDPSTVGNICRSE